MHTIKRFHSYSETLKKYMLYGSDYNVPPKYNISFWWACFNSGPLTDAGRTCTCFFTWNPPNFMRGGKDGFWEAKNRTAAGIRYCKLYCNKNPRQAIWQPRQHNISLLVEAQTDFIWLSKHEVTLKSLCQKKPNVQWLWFRISESLQWVRQSSAEATHFSFASGQEGERERAGGSTFFQNKIGRLFFTLICLLLLLFLVLWKLWAQCSTEARPAKNTRLLVLIIGPGICLFRVSVTHL